MRTAPLRGLVAGLAGFGLIASGLALATLPTANAAISNAPGPLYPYGNSSEPIDESTGLVTIPAGTTYRVSVSVNIGEESDLLPVAQNTTFGIGTFSPTVPANLSVVYGVEYYWSTSGSGFCPPPSNIRAATLTLSAASCYTSLGGIWGMTVKNSTNSAITWDLPTEGVKLSVNGSNIDQTTGLNGQNYSVGASASRQFTQADLANGVALTGDEESIYFNLSTPCFDAASGSVLDVVYVATLDNVAISTTFGSGLNMSWTVNGATMPATFTYLESSPFSIDARLYNVSASEAGKVLKVSIEFKKAGKSVSGECSYGPPTTFAYPTLGALSTAAQAKATAMLGTVSEAMSFPAGTISSDNSFSTPDTGGGVFYWGITGAKVTIVNPGPTMVKPIASTTSKMLSLTLPPGHRFYGFAWYGSARDKWVALSGSVAGYKLWTGNLANATGRAEKTLAYDAPNALCALPSYANVSLLSAPTTFPTLKVTCSPNGNTSGNETVIAKTNIGSAATATLTKLATQGDITTQNKCSFGSTGVNSKATGSDTAIIVYGSIAPTPAEDTGQGMRPECSTTGITGRKITTISQAGVATTTNIAQSPWGGTDPSSILWASGKAANTWIGIGRFGSDYYPLSVSASRVITKKAKKIAFSAATNFSASGLGISESLTPVAEVSDTKWVLVRTQFNMANPMSIKRVYANATLDPATGTVKSGQGLKVENLSMMAPTGRAILSANSRFTASKWYTNFYVLTAAGKYKTATWWVLGT